jgi:hypothetical protein
MLTMGYCDIHVHINGNTSKHKRKERKKKEKGKQQWVTMEPLFYTLAKLIDYA